MKPSHGVEGPMLVLAMPFGDFACCFAPGAVVRWDHAAIL